VITLELDLLIDAQNGNDEAFTSLVEQYQNPVYNLCYRMLGNAQEAEDAAQETFWRAYQAIRRYDRARPFATWLLSIAAHYCIDQQRKKRITTMEIEDWMEEIIPDHAPQPEKQMAAQEERTSIQDLLHSLNPQDRAAVIMRYWYECSEEEISQALQLSVSAVKSRLHRARLKMAQRYQTEQVALAERIHDESPAF
jgi:RNA polymerase sigma-70 factor (ECF subfamily)